MHEPQSDQVTYNATPNLNRLVQTLTNASGLSDDSSLHGMCVCNPPAKRVDIWLRVPYWDKSQQCVKWDDVTKGPCFLSWDTLRFDMGITFKYVFEYAKDAIEGQHQMTFPDGHPEFQG